MITKPPDYKIENVDEMSPFLMSITSSDNHWMFISSNGALTAGREKADHALFPYITDNLIHHSLNTTGPSTKIDLEIAEKTITWRPFGLNKNNGAWMVNASKEANYDNLTPSEQKILNEILNSEFKDQCDALDNYSIYETLPFIKNCNIAVCNDSSFSHLSAALGLPTIVLMADTPIIYGSYSPQMHPILPDGVSEVKHNTLGKDKINPSKIFEKFQSLLN